MDHQILTHNGTITMRNPATGNHRTVMIKTQKDDDGFMPGERLVYLMNGSDNEHDYLQIGLLKSSGRVIVWKRLRGVNMVDGDGGPSQYERLALMLEYPEHYEELGVEYMFSTTCRRCNRKLTTPESIQSGIGPVCATRE